LTGARRDTITSAIESDAPPRSERAPTGSKLDPFKEWICEQLQADSGLAVMKHRALAIDLDAQLAIERRKRPQVRLRRPADSSRRDTGRVPIERAVRKPLEALQHDAIAHQIILRITHRGCWLRPLGQTPLWRPAFSASTTAASFSAGLNWTISVPASASGAWPGGI
jgi:hypothetical protein